MSRNAGIQVIDNDHIKAVAMAVEEAIKTDTQKECITFFLTIFFNHHLFFDTAFDEASLREKAPTALCGGKPKLFYRPRILRTWGWEKRIRKERDKLKEAYR
jgi:hypothetical protein